MDTGYENYTTVLGTDQITGMSEDELITRVKSTRSGIYRTRDADRRVDTQPDELDLCYLQRELEVRHRRRDKAREMQRLREEQWGGQRRSAPRGDFRRKSAE